MEITKHGIVAISEDDIFVTGFAVDGSKGDEWLPANASDLIIEWAIGRLMKATLKGQVTVSEEAEVT